ncbi:MAG: hypothetical protein JEZ05_04135 [Tenericutes bacterium]|nr:hypothetical protein [Mycoplasmatota bacterium]
MMNDYINIENNEDIIMFKEKASSFYDSVLKEIHYESGSTRDHESNSLHPFDTLAEVKMIFESQCNKGKIIELIFEHIERLNLVPTSLNYDSLFENPSIFFCENFIYFSRYENDVLKLGESSCENTWLKAKNAKYIIK